MKISVSLIPGMLLKRGEKAWGDIEGKHENEGAEGRGKTSRG